MELTPEPQEDRGQAHHKERCFRALLESAPDAMVIVSSRGEVVLVNGQTEDLLGERREELPGSAGGASGAGTVPRGPFGVSAVALYRAAGATYGGGNGAVRAAQGCGGVSG